MDTVWHKHRDFIQNISIVLLSVSAVFLFAQTQLINLSHGESRYLDRLVGPPAVSEPAAIPTRLTDLPAPVRVAVSGTYGRHGDIALTTADELFSETLGPLLREALGSAQEPAVSDSQHFLAALRRPSVYYDFLSPLPLSILAGLVNETLPDSSETARSLVLSLESSSLVYLYLWNGAHQYTRCSVAVSPASLNHIISSFELGSAYFAFDRREASKDFAQIDPRSLFLAGELPELPVLTASTALSDTGILLTGMRFNPSTKFRYTEANGTEVISEGGRTLRIYKDGTVTYHSGGEAALKIASAGEIPTETEAVLGVTSLLNRLLGGAPGNAFLYLEHISQIEHQTVLRFGYQVDGVPILSDVQAAEVVLEGTAVQSMTLSFRQYTASTELSLLLPLQQALAIAAREPEQELFIGYADNGSASVSASWLLG